MDIYYIEKEIAIQVKHKEEIEKQIGRLRQEKERLLMGSNAPTSSSKPMVTEAPKPQTLSEYAKEMKGQTFLEYNAQTKTGG